MAEISLQGARVGALVGKLKAAGVTEHVRVRLEPSLAATPSRATILRHPAVVKGEPRSDVNTNGEAGCCSRWRRRKARSSLPLRGCTDGEPFLARTSDAANSRRPQSSRQQPPLTVRDPLDVCTSFAGTGLRSYVPPSSTLQSLRGARNAWPGRTYQRCPSPLCSIRTDETRYRTSTATALRIANATPRNAFHRVRLCRSPTKRCTLVL
jgi:hypothetical protein